jgi:hypothetical protein
MMMTPTPSPRRLALALALLSPAVACGDDSPPPAGKQPRDTPTKVDLPEPPAGGSSTGAAAGGTTEWFEGDSGWEEADESGGGSGGDSGDDGTPTADTGADAPAPPRYLGPCAVSWSKAARLRFKYDDDAGGGSVRIDADRDGKSDVCATFEFADGKTTLVAVDEGCDKKTELTIAPQYEEGSNVATATYKEDGAQHEITLVSLPSFSGVAPGYPLYAAKKDIKLSVRTGLVRTATVKKPTDGPPVKVTFTYDKEQRIQRISEDADLDGTVDRKFDYRYDAAGNVKGVTLTMGPKGEQTKSTAAFSYACWKETDAG